MVHKQNGAAMKENQLLVLLPSQGAWLRDDEGGKQASSKKVA